MRVTPRAGSIPALGTLFIGKIDNLKTAAADEIDESLPPLSQERLQQELLLEYIGALGEALRPERSR